LVNAKSFLQTLLSILLINCVSTPERSPFKIKELTNGFNSLEAYKLQKQDSFESLPPIPPPLTEAVIPNNVIEAKDGRVYFYTFARRQNLCGYLMEGVAETYSPYTLDLDTLSAKSLILLDTSNMDELIQKIPRENREWLGVSIGISKVKSTNAVLLYFVNKLYQNPHKNVWQRAAPFPTGRSPTARSLLY
jgi:hypothetical protein